MKIEDIDFGENFYLVQEDIYENHNHSLFNELILRNGDNYSCDAIWYKGKSISYKILIEMINIYAKSLWNLGFRKGMEIPVCFSNTPQFIYIFFAASKIGAVINSIGAWFDAEYYIDILHCSKSKIFFCSSNYEKMFSNVFREEEVDIISFSTGVDGLTDHEKLFLDNAKNEAKIESGTNIDAPFTITYTSGTTNPGRPKAVLHASRSYMFLARYKDPDVSGMPSMRGTRIFSHIPFYVHASLSTSVVDPLFQGCCIVLEELYDSSRFPNAIIEGKPNQVCASVGFWLSLAEYLEKNPKTNMSFLYLPTVSGEGLSIGEERYLNYIARKHRFGTSRFPFNIIPVTFSIGGGTTESSGVLVTLFKRLQENRLKNRKNKPIGLQVLDCACMCVLDEERNSIAQGKIGSAWFYGPCNMISYYYDDDRMENIKFIDGKGRTWLRMEACVIQQGEKLVKILGRDRDYIEITSNKRIPYYIIQESLYKKLKNLLSCDIVEIDEQYVFHLKFRPDKTFAINQMLLLIEKILFGLEINKSIKDIYISFHSEVYELAPSGKRNLSVFRELGIQNARKIEFR